MTSEAGYPPDGDQVRDDGQSRYAVPEVPEAYTPFSAFGSTSKPEGDEPQEDYGWGTQAAGEQERNDLSELPQRQSAYPPAAPVYAQSQTYPPAPLTDDQADAPQGPPHQARAAVRVPGVAMAEVSQGVISPQNRPQPPAHSEFSSYADSQPSYAEPPPYGETPSYAEPQPYAQPPPYGETPSYADSQPYAEPPPYGEAPSYVEPPSHSWSNDSAGQANRPVSGGVHGAAAPVQPASPAPYGQAAPYEQAAYEQAKPYEQTPYSQQASYESASATQTPRQQQSAPPAGVYGRPRQFEEPPHEDELPPPPPPPLAGRAAVASARVSVPGQRAPESEPAQSVSGQPAGSAIPPARASAPSIAAAGSAAVAGSAPVAGSASVAGSMAVPPPASSAAQPLSAPPAPGVQGQSHPMAGWQEQLQPAAPVSFGSPVGSAQVSGPGGGARPQGSAQVSAQPMSAPQGPLFGHSVPVAAANSADEPIEPVGSGLKKWGYIAIALLVVLLGAGALYYTSRPNPPTYDVGNCVKESGGKAAEVPCSESDAYQIVSKVSDPSRCPNANQPYATIDGSILCLKKK